MSEQIKNALASYGRSVIGAATALYMAGVTDPADLSKALLAALIPVALRAINTNDKAFGRMPATSDVEEALKSVKKPSKKKAAK